MVYLLWYLYIITAQVQNAGISDVVFYMSLIMHIILILLATGQIRVLLRIITNMLVTVVFQNLHLKSSWKLILNYFGPKNLPIWHLLPWAWNNWQSQSPPSVQAAPLRHSWGHEPARNHSSLLVDTVFFKEVERSQPNFFIVKSWATILAEKINQPLSPFFNICLI